MLSLFWIFRIWSLVTFSLTDSDVAQCAGRDVLMRPPNKIIFNHKVVSCEASL
jgi:hypothetical protein